MGGAVAVQDDRARLDQRRLAAAGLVHRRIAGAARYGARSQQVQAQLRALARQWRGQDLIAVARSAGGTGAALPRAHDRYGAALVQAQQLRQTELEPAGDPGCDMERRAGLPTLDLGQHRRAHSGASRQIAQ